MEALQLLTFFVLVCARSGNSELTCPEVDDGKDVYIPSDTNCMEYYHCVHGIPVMMICPFGLFWDQSNQFCNWPDQISPPCTADCPSEGWLRRDEVSNCYLFGTEKMTFAEAQQFCKDNGGKLAEPRRKIETNAINRIINEEAGGMSYWIGLTDNDREGTFTWLSDDSEVQYSDWAHGEPNDQNDEDCTHLRKAKEFQWNDFSCNARNGNTALCQKF